MLYNQKILQHFQNPKNMGQIKNPTVKGRAGNAVCGDEMELTLKIEDGIIKDAKFLTFGCAAAIAASSILTEMIIGKKISEAKKLKPTDVDSSLGGLPMVKKHCANMAFEALNKCLDNLD